MAEVAAVTDVDVGTIKARLHRGRQRLRRTLEPWLQAQGYREAEGVGA